MKPDMLEYYEWSGLKDLNRLAGITAFVLVCLACDCNNFFLKYILWVPPDHDLLKFRVTMIGLCAIPTSKEWYEFISNEHCHRLGPFAWCMIFLSMVETLTVIKFSRSMFVEPFPMYVKVMWSILGAGYAFLIAIAWNN